MFEHILSLQAAVPPDTVAPPMARPAVQEKPEDIPTQIGPKGLRFDFNDGCRVLLPESGATAYADDNPYGLWAWHAGTKPRLTNRDIAADDFFNFACRAAAVVDQDFGTGRQLTHRRLLFDNSEQWCFLRRGRHGHRCGRRLRIKAFQTFRAVRN